LSKGISRAAVVAAMGMASIRMALSIFVAATTPSCHIILPYFPSG